MSVGLRFLDQFLEEEHHKPLNEPEALESIIRNAKTALIFEASFFGKVSVGDFESQVARAGARRKVFVPAKQNAIKIFESFIKAMASGTRYNAQIAAIYRVETRISDLSDFKFRPHIFAVLLSNAQLDPDRLQTWWGYKLPKPACRYFDRNLYGQQSLSLYYYGHAEQFHDEELKAVKQARELFLETATPFERGQYLQLVAKFAEWRRRQEEKNPPGKLTSAGRQELLREAWREHVYKPSYQIGGCRCYQFQLNAPQSDESQWPYVRTLHELFDRIKRPKELLDRVEHDYVWGVTPNLYCFMEGYDELLEGRKTFLHNERSTLPVKEAQKLRAKIRHQQRILRLHRNPRLRPLERDRQDYKPKVYSYDEKFPPKPVTLIPGEDLYCNKLAAKKIQKKQKKRVKQNQ